MQNALDNALLYAATRFKVDDILTRDIAGYKDAVRQRATELLEFQRAGVVLEQCDVESRPPRQLRDPFNGVLLAEVARAKALDESRNYIRRRSIWLDLRIMLKTPLVMLLGKGAG